MPGPTPKRSEERRRRNSPASDRAQSAVASGAALEWPEPDPRWHKHATLWYLSLQVSGQSQFYEPSDVALAVVTADLMTEALSGKLGSATVAGTVKTLMDELLTSEGARRRARLELERKPASGAKPEEDELAAFRARRAEA